ncbi:MAG: hypothetical protein JST82_13760 [Bacteroidetes bacterium]|nr:hypothetical protein [Bacteroidota bacterium]
MAVFSLRSQRTGQYKEFSLLEILKLLGDPVNDEIWLDDGEDVFNLSSFQDNSGSGGTISTPLNWNMENFAQLAGQSAFTLQRIPAPPVLMVMLNGIELRRNADYQMDGTRIQLPFALNAQDSLQCIYTY